MSTKRMGGLGKLSDFGRSTPAPASPPATPTPPPAVEPDPQPSEVEAAEVVSPPPAKPKERKKPAKKVEKPVTINIKIAREQQDWLADTARQVRDNNLDPVPAGDRCYPQHLIQAAIDLLVSSPVNWSEVRNVEDLRNQLNL